MKLSQKGILLQIIIFVFGIGIFFKKIGPTNEVIDAIQQIDKEIVKAKADLLLAQNGIVPNGEISSFSDAQKKIIKLIADYENVTLVSFGKEKEDNEIEERFNVEVSGDQNDLILWYRYFDLNFQEAKRTSVELYSDKGTLYLKMYFTLKYFEKSIQ